MYDGSSRSVGESGIGARQLALIHTYRQLMEQQLRLFCEVQRGILYQLPGQESLHIRLQRNARDLAEALRRFYGPRKTEEAASLFSGRYRLYIALLQKRSSLQPEEADQLRRRWAQNAGEIARFLSVINPFWENGEWRARLLTQMQLLETAYELRAEARWEEELDAWDQLEDLSPNGGLFLQRPDPAVSVCLTNSDGPPSCLGWRAVFLQQRPSI